jgi:hypothetical protein
MFEMAAPIQGPAKCEVHFVIRFLKAKGERPVEVQKQIVVLNLIELYKLYQATWQY